MADRTKEYWLVDPDPERLATEMLSRITRYAERMSSSGKADVWRRMSRLYFSRDSDSGLSAQGVQIGGEAGELIGTRSNLLGRYVRAVGVLITGSRPSYTARAISNSAQAISQVSVCNSWLDYVLSKRGAESAAKQAQTYCMLYGHSWLGSTWDESLGRRLGQDADGRALFEGDVSVRALRPDEVVYDVDLDTSSQHAWLIVSRQCNRYRLVQQYPQYRDHILESSTRTRLDDLRDTLRLDGWSSRKSNGDLVQVYELFAPASPEAPEGRYAMMLGDKVIGLDRSPYDDLAHYPMQPEAEPGSKDGHSFLWDLIGPQQVSDDAFTSIISTVSNFGKPVLFEPVDAALSTDKANSNDPFRYVQGNTPPQWVALPADILSALTQAKQAYDDTMLAVSGLNDAAVGDAGKSQSGEALATMHSLALQSVSSDAAAYADAFSAMMMGCVLRARTFAKSERLIRIAGRGYKSDVIKFCSSSIASIDTVDVEMGAASLRHSAGKKEFADRLWASGAITDPESYLEVMATGKLEPILGRPRSQRALIEAENERLREGVACWVSPTDDDRYHIKSHSCELDDIALRQVDPVTGMLSPAAQVVIDHVMQHVESLRNKDPDLADALGTLPMPSWMQQQAPVAPPMDPNAAPAPLAGDPNALGTNGGLPPTGADGADVSQGPAQY